MLCKPVCKPEELFAIAMCVLCLAIDRFSLVETALITKEGARRSFMSVSRFLYLFQLSIHLLPRRSQDSLKNVSAVRITHLHRCLDQLVPRSHTGLDNHVESAGWHLAHCLFGYLRHRRWCRLLAHLELLSPPISSQARSHRCHSSSATSHPQEQ